MKDRILISDRLGEIRRFLPALYFVGRFVGLYVVGNILYGWMVESYAPKPDPATAVVSEQTANLLSSVGYVTQTQQSVHGPYILLHWSEKNILAVYEGCNGLNVMIVFLSFLVGMGPYGKRMLWFVPFGLLIIHGMNLMRIGGLFFVAIYRPAEFYFIHKYLFTAVLYVVVFLLWIWWLRMSREQLQKI